MMSLYGFIWLTGSAMACILTLAYSLKHDIKTEAKYGEIVGSLILGLLFSWSLVLVHLIMIYRKRW